MAPENVIHDRTALNTNWTGWGKQKDNAFAVHRGIELLLDLRQRLLGDDRKLWLSRGCLMSRGNSPEHNDKRSQRGSEYDPLALRHFATPATVDGQQAIQPPTVERTQLRALRWPRCSRRRSRHGCASRNSILCARPERVQIAEAIRKEPGTILGILRRRHLGRLRQEPRQSPTAGNTRWLPARLGQQQLE